MEEISRKVHGYRSMEKNLLANKDVKDVNTETAKEKHGAVAEYKKIFAQCQGQMYFSLRFRHFHCTQVA